MTKLHTRPHTGAKINIIEQKNYKVVLYLVGLGNNKMFYVETGSRSIFLRILCCIFVFLGISGYRISIKLTVRLVGAFAQDILQISMEL